MIDNWALLLVEQVECTDRNLILDVTEFQMMSPAQDGSTENIGKTAALMDILASLVGRRSDKTSIFI